VGPAPGGGLPLRRHCDRPQDVLPFPQQASSQGTAPRTSQGGDVGGKKPLPPARTRCVPAAVALCVPSASCSSARHCCALVAAVVRVPCVATAAQMLRSSAMARAAAAASACCCDWSGCCLRCSGGAVMLSRRPHTGTCTRLHHCQELLPPLRIRVGASHSHRAAPTSHACEATPRTFSASSAACTAVPTTNRSMSRYAPSPWLTQIDSAPLAARARCSTSRRCWLLRGLPRVVCEELRRAAASAG
jgi:hypothetical protein